MALCINPLAFVLLESIENCKQVAVSLVLHMMTPLYADEVGFPL